MGCGPGVKGELLALLFARQGETLSGQEAAQKLCVSRTAVWKAAEALRGEGLPLEACKGRGYRLSPASDILRAEALQPLLPGVALRWLPTADSTNVEAKRWAARGAPHGALVVAGCQSAGRGRMGRSFQSPPGGIYMSVVLRPKNGQQGLSLITAAAAVAACRAVEELCGLSLSIKWVNDLFYKGKKCCGILTEGAAGFESGQFEYLVTGIGLNYTTPEAALGPELALLAGSLFPGGPALAPRAALIADIHKKLLLLFEGLPKKPFLEEYRARNLVPGRRVQVRAAEPYEAEALFIDGEARLVVRAQDGELRALSSGEVSVLVQ